jgi:signal transduction histidine kinase
MKPKFAYLYLAFIVSIIVLVVLTFLFYNRLNSHIRYTGEFNDTYSVVLSLRALEESMAELESNSRGYLLLRDSSLLSAYEENRDSVNMYLDVLKETINDNSDQMRRFLLMRSTVLHQLNIYNRMIRLDPSEPEGTLSLLLSRSKGLMEAFREETKQIERAEVHQRDELLKTKDFYETFYPSYFNTISIWAGIVTLVSFYFINREVRMRRRYQSELEKRLHELNRSNSELRQFAYIASHDLQEPLRKIRTFSDKLVYKHQHSIDAEVKTVISRIEASAQRMQELIQDMLNFTSLINKEESVEPVDLNDVVTKVLADYVEISRERHAIITWDTLPEIYGDEAQLSLLFKSLIDNAFKFSKPGESPVIRISHKVVDKAHEEDELLKGKSYHKIVMEDKGIGFNNEFAEKIFMIFQRLHTQQSGYRGKGIGLAIAQRIMTNHNGVILARGMINDGATFIMYFPVPSGANSQS